MRALVQRVSSAQVEVDGEVVGEIGRGLLVYVGLGKNDSAQTQTWIIEKIFNLRIFENEQGKTDHSVLDLDGEVLFVSQFTLYGDVAKGRRPSFDDAMPSTDAGSAYARFVAAARAYRSEGRAVRKIADGRFQADMRVSSVNEGPFTIWIDSEKSGKI